MDGRTEDGAPPPHHAARSARSREDGHGAVLLVVHAVAGVGRAAVNTRRGGPCVRHGRGPSKEAEKGLLPFCFVLCRPTDQASPTAALESTCTVTAPRSEADGRRARAPGGIPVAVASEPLAGASIPRMTTPGSLVVIDGLASKPEYNGRPAAVVSEDLRKPEDKRYNVFVDGTTKKLSLRAQNLLPHDGSSHPIEPEGAPPELVRVNGKIAVICERCGDMLVRVEGLHGGDEPLLRWVALLPEDAAVGMSSVAVRVGGDIGKLDGVGAAEPVGREGDGVDGCVG